jgi:hypothetical protein
VDDDELAHIVDAVAAQKGLHRHAGVVDVGLREGKHHPLPVDARLGNKSALLPALEPLAVAFGQEGDDVGAEVVARAAVLRFRVAEADDEQVGRCAGTAQQGLLAPAFAATFCGPLASALG